MGPITDTAITRPNDMTTHTYSYDDADQLTSDGTVSFTYDAAVDLLTAGSDSVSWSWDPRLASATVNSVTTTYATDGLGVRVATTTGLTTTDLLWDRLAPLPLLVDDGTMAYLHAGGLLAEIDGSDDVLYHLTDALGSVRGLTDDVGDLVGTAEYEAFGGVRSSSGASSVFGFTGELTDPTTGFVHLRARDYNPTTGRFTSMDTVQPNAPGTQGYNRCAYVANNPARWTDPSGHAVGDVAALQGPIGVILEQVRALGQITIALMPALMALGMLANPIGLVLAVQFLMLALLLITIIAQAIALIQDPFTFYDGLAPVEWAKPLTPWEVEDASNRYPETPADDCPSLKCALLMHGLKVPPGVDIHANIRLARSHRLLNPFYSDSLLGLTIGRIPPVGAVFFAHDIGNWMWLVSKVKTGGKWDYKNLYNDGEYEPYGNFHFGVIAAAMDMRLDVALRGGGAYQVYSFGKAALAGDPQPPVHPPFGDDLRDSAWVSRGYLWYELCAE